MRRRRTLVAVTAGALSLALAACGGGSASDDGTDDGGGDDAAKPVQNAAVGKVFAPSDKKGGTIRMATTENWDSVDPGDTYYALSWNLVRLYGRSLVMYKSAPGEEGNTLVPDLAESLGEPSADNKTWTYTLREGIKFDDGTPVTSKDVKYAVARSLDKEVLPNGPGYFNDWLDVGDYKGAFKDKNLDNFTAVETPDDRTVVFKLKAPFAGFDYMAMLPSTVPVPQAKDTGTKYKEKVIATGPYKFESYAQDKNFTLVRNDQWDPATDPNRPALPDKITMTYGVNADDLDNRLLAGELDVDVSGVGVQAAAQGRILTDEALKARSDLVPDNRLSFTAINGDVPPLDNVECRRAIEYAVDRTGYSQAYGGPQVAPIATHLTPPGIAGSTDFDLYPAGPDSKGDVAKAKEALTKCGQPNGFETNAAFRQDRPKEKAAAENLQQSLARVGIKLTLKGYPTGDYFELYAGKPAFAKQQKLGLMQHAWGADWADGYGFLSQIIDSRVIRASGNYNLTVKSKKVDSMIDQALQEQDKDARDKLWADIDKQVMEEAFILPGVFYAGILYRPETLTNVFSTAAYGMYDYVGMGVKQ